MRTSDFDYQLPPELIAQTPLEPRDASRLLVLNRATGRMEHSHFDNLVDYLRPGDVLVLNESRVIPARLRGRRADTGGKVEILLLRREGPGVWEALAKPGRRLRPGVRIELEAPGSEIATAPIAGVKSPLAPLSQRGVGGICVEVLAAGADGVKTVRLSREDAIYQVGEAPLPPYIRRRLEDPERYQTVYARQPGSVAAPTAGLHFTHALLERLRQAGVEQAVVTLHVGLDTFAPVYGEDPTEHKIHTEEYEVGPEAAAALNRARAQGRRIIAVGTTTVRVLEQVAQDTAESGREELEASRGRADLFILPGHRFRLVDALITNFHLPRTTLLMLVSAFAGRYPFDQVSTGLNPRLRAGSSTGSGLGLVLQAYQEAIVRRYRFYSFGDAMLIV